MVAIGFVGTSVGPLKENPSGLSGVPVAAGPGVIVLCKGKWGGGTPSLTKTKRVVLGRAWRVPG